MTRPFRLRPLLAAIGCGLLVIGSANSRAQGPGNADLLLTPAKAQQSVPVSGAQLLYVMFLSELAAARGSLPEAAASYIDLTRKTQDPRLARRATEIAIASQQGQLASEAARLWATTDPSSATALQTFAVVLAGNATQIEELEAALQALLALDDTPRRSVFLQLPQAFSRFPDRAAASAAVFRLTSIDLSVAEAHFARALSALAARQVNQAEESATEALRLRSDWEAASLLRARAIAVRDQSAAMEAIHQFGDAHPSAVESRLAYARWLGTEKRISEMRTAYERLLQEFPQNDELAYSVMPLAVLAQDYETAEAIVRKLSEKGFREGDVLRIQLGQILEERDKPTEAMAQYESVTSGQHYATARARLAQLMARTGNIDGARSALSIPPNMDSDGKILLLRTEADILRQTNRIIEAYDVLGNALAIEPDNPDVLYDAALLAERLKRSGIMEKRLRHLIELKPDHAHAYNALGYSFADRNVNLAEADQLLQKALELAPNDPAILDSMGWLRFRQGKLGPAGEFIGKAYALLKDAEVAAHLCEVLWSEGRFADARQLLLEASTQSPDSEALRALKLRLGM